MQNKSLFTLVFMGCLLFCACEKYEGTISGNVVFMEDGRTYPAVDAIITKMKVKGAKEIAVAKGKTDTCGNYVLNHVSKGSWKVVGRLEIDSLVYEGESDVIEIDGNKEVVNLVLMPVINWQGVFFTKMKSR